MHKYNEKISEMAKSDEGSIGASFCFCSQSISNRIFALENIFITGENDLGTQLRRLESQII